MSLSETAAHPGASAFAEVAVSGPDQRIQDRYIAQKTAVDVDRQRCRVYDISTGGVRMKAPPEARMLGAEISGMLVCKAGGADIRVMVRGTVVRLESDGETVGVRFAALAAPHREAVEAVITLIERLEVEAAFQKASEPKKSPPLLRAAVAAAVFSAAFGIAVLYLWVRSS